MNIKEELKVRKAVELIAENAKAGKSAAKKAPAKKAEVNNTSMFEVLEKGKELEFKNLILQLNLKRYYGKIYRT